MDWSSFILGLSIFILFVYLGSGRPSWPVKRVDHQDEDKDIEKLARENVTPTLYEGYIISWNGSCYLGSGYEWINCRTGESVSDLELQTKFHSVIHLREELKKMGDL